MLEVADPALLPPYPYLVRRDGRAVAAYPSEERAREHAWPLENASVWLDRCTALEPQRHSRVAQEQRERDGRVVDQLAARWLAGGAVGPV